MSSVIEIKLQCLCGCSAIVPIANAEWHTMTIEELRKQLAEARQYAAEWRACAVRHMRGQDFLEGVESPEKVEAFPWEGEK